MDPPGITRHRRPFLAPLWLGLLATLTIAGVGLTLYRSATTTVVLLVRPVEKQPGSIDDPPLSPDPPTGADVRKSPTTSHVRAARPTRPIVAAT